MQKRQKTLSFRALCAGGAVISITMLSFAYWVQYGLKIEPCALCLLQRWVLWIIFALFAFGSVLPLHRHFSRVIYSAGVMFFGFMGMLLAGRHIYLQHLPKGQVPECTASLERMLAYEPLLEVLKTVLTASGECARIDFTLLSLSLATWTFIGFTGLVGYVFLIFFLFLQKKRRS